MELQMRIIFLFVVIISCDAEEVKHLAGTEGGSITLPHPVLEQGYLLVEKNMIVVVEQRNSRLFDKNYKDKVVWNNNTGLFTITRLQRNDSGIYYVNSETGRPSYNLTVYGPVPAPAVKTLNESAESCTLQCFVEKVETKLLWLKDEEVVNQSSSALSLPLTVHKQDFKSSFRCEAANPAEKKTFPVNVMIFCSGANNTDSNTRHHTIGIVIAIVSCVSIIIAAIIIKQKYFDKSKRTTRHTQASVSRESDVQYTDIHILDDRRTQEGDLPDSSGAVAPSNLTTVYDKLEAHRMEVIYIDS